MTDMNDTDVFEPVARRPDRTFRIDQQIIPDTYVGPMTKTETLTINNNTGNSITVSQPQVVDSSTAAAVPEITISTPANLTIADGGTKDFDLTFSENIDGTGGKFRDAYIRFDWTDATRTCSFGPIWLQASFWINPL